MKLKVTWRSNGFCVLSQQTFSYLLFLLLLALDCPLNRLFFLSSFILTTRYFTVICLFILYVFVCMLTCHTARLWRSGDDLCKSIFPSAMWVQGLNLDRQAWWQAPANPPWQACTPFDWESRKLTAAPCASRVWMLDGISPLWIHMSETCPSAYSEMISFLRDTQGVPWV